MKLAHDAGLRRAVDGWMLTLDEVAFTEALPLFRRVFPTLDGNERRVLLDQVLGRRGTALAGLRLAGNAAALWDDHLTALQAIFDRRDA